MPKHKVAEAAESRCECCGGETDAPLIARHGGYGLKSCFRCLNMSGAELAVAYGRRLRRIAER